MKTVVFTLLATLLASQVSFAGSSKVLWECSAYDVENATITETNGQVTGDLAWDCWPGGGICNAKANLVAGQDRSSDLVYRGSYFWLIIHTSEAPVNGVYKAHLIAKDKVDPIRQGRDMLFNEFITCKLNK
jgi:hypothetical protein